MWDGATLPGQTRPTFQRNKLGELPWPWGDANKMKIPGVSMTLKEWLVITQIRGVMDETPGTRASFEGLRDI